MRLIGLMGYKGCGKSTVAQTLVENHGFQRVRFADGIKRMLRTIGLTDAQVDGDEKEIPLPLLQGKTPRWAMQSLGTEWGRTMLGPEIWISVCQQDLLAIGLANPDACVVIDDVRFPNEAAMIKAMGGEIWRVRRPEIEPAKPNWWQKILQLLHISAGTHASELYWRLLPADREIANSGDLTQLQNKVKAACNTKLPVALKGEKNDRAAVAGGFGQRA